MAAPSKRKFHFSATTISSGSELYLSGNIYICRPLYMKLKHFPCVLLYTGSWTLLQSCLQAFVTLWRSSGHNKIKLMTSCFLKQIPQGLMTSILMFEMRPNTRKNNQPTKTQNKQKPSKSTNQKKPKLKPVPILCFRVPKYRKLFHRMTSIKRTLEM